MPFTVNRLCKINQTQYQNLKLKVVEREGFPNFLRWSARYAKSVCRSNATWKHYPLHIFFCTAFFQNTFIILKFVYRCLPLGVEVNRLCHSPRY